jgi:putative PIN family toxin of toxin-antitoxin system
MAEYEAVLNRPKFNLPQWVIQELLSYIHSHADWVTSVGKEWTLARDPSDEKFLATAVSGQVDWLVSGDADLLVLDEIEGIPIIPPWEFLSVL